MNQDLKMQTEDIMKNINIYYENTRKIQQKYRYKGLNVPRTKQYSTYKKYPFLNCKSNLNNMDNED